MNSAHTGKTGLYVILCCTLIVLSVTLVSRARMRGGQPAIPVGITGSGGVNDAIVHTNEIRSSNEGLPIVNQTHLSDAVMLVEVDTIADAKFNTDDGGLPQVGAFEGDPLAFPTYDPDAITDEGYADLYDVWRENNGLHNPWLPRRLAVMTVVTVLKGITTTEKLITILPGGVITITHESFPPNVYETYVRGVDELAVGDTGVAFMEPLNEYLVTYGGPVYSECLDLAELMTENGDEARCGIIGAFYSQQGDNFTSAKSLGSVIDYSGLVDEVDTAKATLEAGSVISMTDTFAPSAWPYPTATP